MASIFNGQRRIGVHIVPDGTKLHNMQPVIGVREVADGLLFSRSERVVGIDVLTGSEVVYNDQVVLGAVVISDAIAIYNGLRVIPSPSLGVGATVPLTIVGTPGGLVVGTPFSFTPAVTGGSGAKTFSISGALPDGLIFSPINGSVSGTPTTVGTASGISITVTDSSGSVTLPSFSLVVSAAPIPISISGTPPEATVGTPYTFTPSTAGGSGAKSFGLTGALPAGLSFDVSTGAITGTPTTAATTSGLSITVTDASGSATLSGLSIVVNAETPVEPVIPEQARALEDGEARSTEDGEIRVVEGSTPQLMAPLGSQFYYGNTAPVMANTLGIQIYTPT